MGDGGQVALRDVDVGETAQMERNFEILEKMLYIDTFFKSTLTTFDREGGKDVKSKEINSFIAQSFNNVLSKDIKNQHYNPENEKITVSVDHSLQKIMFIRQETADENSYFSFRQYKIGQNY